uniref:Cytosolic fatty-acid binding proteins domain-containing protein n=1 Tax=Heliothis virescens TaxID=7102 RepID=A0A2A4IZ24_HELVI
MSFLNKTYSFVKQENLDGFLKSVGFPEDKIEKVLKFTPDQKITKDGDTYTLFTQGLEGPKETKFKSGVEFDDIIGFDKIPAKVTFAVDGKTITQTVKTDKGNGTFKREYVGDELIIHVTRQGWDGVAKRYYKVA